MTNGYGALRSVLFLAVAGASALGGCGDGAQGNDIPTDGDASVADGGSTGPAVPSADGGGPTPGTDGATPASALRFVVYGDSRSNPDLHQSVVDAFAKTDPQLVVDTGDLWDGYGAARWKSIITKNANIGALLTQNMFLVSRGNHETVAELLDFAPTLVRDNQETYSFVAGNSFFVSLGMDPSRATTYLGQQLEQPAAKTATWRFVYSHFPIYSGGDHGAKGDAAIEALCDKYDVTIYFSGHDHIYERSHQMLGQAVADTGDALTATKGTVYLVAGGGGAPLYSARKIASTHTSLSTLSFVALTATSTMLTATAYKPDGTTFDAFTIAR